MSGGNSIFFLKCVEGILDQLPFLERKEEIALFVDVQAHLTNDFLEDIGSCASLRDSSFLHGSSRPVHEEEEGHRVHSFLSVCQLTSLYSSLILTFSPYKTNP